MKAQGLPTPTRELVHEVCDRFNNNERTGSADRALQDIFIRYSNNEVLEHVLIKVVLLNGLYNTNVYAVTEMAIHIRDLDIDTSLEEGSLEIVDQIARLTIGGKTRRHYSFATKYCSWHRPDVFPIYDTLVLQILTAYRDQYGFAQFTQASLQDYLTYKKTIESFRSHFQLEGLSLKRIDKFLWLTSLELSS